MNGLMTPGTSAGSKNVGASEMCTAHVSWPSGAAARASGASNAMDAHATATIIRKFERHRRAIIDPPRFVCVVPRSLSAAAEPLVAQHVEPVVLVGEVDVSPAV